MGSLLRRGPGTKSPFYGLAVHGDYGIGFEEYLSGMEGFLKESDYTFSKLRSEYEKKDTEGFMMINFWRPVLPMKGPVKKIPFGLCDITSVKKIDLVRKRLYGFLPGSKDPLFNSSLKFNSEHKWYYYPDMTVDETIVFKQFLEFKDDP